ncbi:hypothetical protein PV396_20660 [Streptomyces sp. ME02-8801-2C]|uniref:hypothetical protein n=1 Tax=Streptomyces sp. ME02-8801-2C TaxID=3028680 RepID=UPI0029AEA15D|nr:hypothetical protein [Streptomyces sp. ME02-8801-2C]MDX3454324.1 hypothetical protein [Streptomyces sp. ME02-8801-2C]
MPQLPEDIIDRLTAMERRIQQLSTAVNSRPALNRVAGGGVEITDGGWLHVLPASGDSAVFSVGAGGLARPWLAMLPPQDTTVTRWPQTTATAWTTIAVSHNPLWQPSMRLRVQSGASSGATGSVRVLVGGAQWGDTVAAGSDFDRTAAVTDDLAASLGSLLRVEIQAQVTSTSGTVYAQPQLMYGCGA